MKKGTKKIVKILAYTLVSLCTFLLIYLIAAFTFSRIAVNKNAQTKEEVTIYILSNGVHTDIVVPVKNEVINWSNWVKFENTIGNDSTAKFVAFGWGDKGFYLETPTWAELKFSVAFRAAFALSSSAIHTTFYSKLSENEKCKLLKISVSDYEKLVSFILGSFQKSIEGKLIHIQTNAVYGSNDAFYEANGRYSLFHTCNTWANNGLKACGQKACFWTPFDTGIFYHYQH